MAMAAAALTQRTILIVEDDPSARATLADVLADEGYRCVAAADGREAIAWLTGGVEPPCAILLDLMMPGMNGWELHEWLRAQPRLASVPVVVLSAVRDGAQEAARMGVAAFIQKPIGLEELLATVERYCGGP